MVTDLTLENFTFSKKVAIGEEVDVSQVSVMCVPDECDVCPRCV